MALEAEDTRLFASLHDTAGFARRYQRSSNPFADPYGRNGAVMSRTDPDSAFNPVNRNDPDNPLNPMNRNNWDNPMNPMNDTHPRNPASPFNRGVYGLPFAPLR